MSGRYVSPYSFLWGVLHGSAVKHPPVRAAMLAALDAAARDPDYDPALLATLRSSLGVVPGGHAHRE